MSINYGLLISSPTFQESLIDKSTGLPMYGGTVTCYQDKSRTTLKNWYYQVQVGASYQFFPLPNPLTLSAAGSVTDINGVDTMPFFYPYVEDAPNNAVIIQRYYITIVNFPQTNEITRPNFPYNLGEGTNPVVSNNTSVDNYIINNVFWRNLGTMILTNATQAVVAPSQHDTFQFPDITFLKSIAGAVDTVTFTKFTESDFPILTGDITPEFYLNHVCTAGSSDTYKFYLFPISSSLLSLSNPNQEYIITIQAMSTSNSPITLTLIQDPGSNGTSTPSFVPNNPMSFALNGSWQKFILPGLLPVNSLIPLSPAGDDALYLQVGLPAGLSGTCNISFTKPSFYLTNIQYLPTNNFSTYDQIDAVINSPRTGDVRTSINSWFYWGWLPMNDGLIGLSNPGSNNQYIRANSDTWQLFNLLWDIGKTYDSGVNFNPLFQMFTNTAGVLAATNYGTSAYADFTAITPAKALQLPFAMGEVFVGSVPISALLPATPVSTGYTSAVTASNAAPGTLFTTVSANILNLFLGNTVTFTSTTTLVNVKANTVYYLVPISATTFKVALSFDNAIAIPPVIVAYTGVETGTVTAYLQLTGSGEGEYAHKQLASEVGPHDHPPLGPDVNFASVIGGSGGFAGGGVELATALRTGINTPNSVPFNVTQPGIFYNIFIKL